MGVVFVEKSPREETKPETIQFVFKHLILSHEFYFVLHLTRWLSKYPWGPDNVFAYYAEVQKKVKRLSQLFIIFQIEFSNHRKTVSFFYIEHILNASNDYFVRFRFRIRVWLLIAQESEDVFVLAMVSGSKVSPILVVVYETH